jgi:hypothetical protein
VRTCKSCQKAAAVEGAAQNFCPHCGVPMEEGPQRVNFEDVVDRATNIMQLFGAVRIPHDITTALALRVLATRLQEGGKNLNRTNDLVRYVLAEARIEGEVE